MQDNFNGIDFEQLDDKFYRMNNLYRIIDKKGNDVPYRLNPVQADVLANIHNRNAIIKARQLGMSTYCVLDLLDDTLFENNHAGGIVSYSLEHAQHIFKRIIGHAIDTLPKWLNPHVKARSAREMTLGNNSVLRVDTTLRGGSYQKIVVSEYGKTCARNPIKAEEVMTGTIQAVAKEGRVTIESTGEGSDGYFADIVTNAAKRGNEALTPLDYKLFFYSWMDDPSYILNQKVKFDVEMTDYFAKLEEKIDIRLTQEQKNWYVVQSKVLGDKLKQEYPSTVEECFLSTSEAYYFALALAKAESEGRFLSINPYDALLPVYVAMDIGVNDLTVMTFFQVAHGEVRIIDAYADNNKDVPFYCDFLLRDKRYFYHTIFLPHDARKRDPLDITNTYEYEFRKRFSGTNTKVTVLPALEKQISITQTKIKLNVMVFNFQRTKKFIDNCKKYRKKWSEPLGRYLSEPLHNIASNYGDALQYTAQAVRHIERSSGLSGAFERHQQAIDSRRDLI